LPRGVDFPLDSFPFQKLEKALGHGVVMTVASATHAGYQTTALPFGIPISGISSPVLQLVLLTESFERTGLAFGRLLKLRQLAIHLGNVLIGVSLKEGMQR
jgi:hypothetical protein